MTCPTRRAAARISSHGINTYLYTFLYTPIADPLNNTTYCHGEACHGAELAYVFHSAGLDKPYHFMNEVSCSMIT